MPQLAGSLPAEGAAVAANSYPDERAPQRAVEAWRIDAGRGFTAAPRVRGALIVAAHTGRDLTVRETATGALYWRRRFSNPITALTVVDGVIYFAERGTGESRTHAIALYSADDVWESRLRRARLAPVALDSSVIFSNDAGELSAHALDTGRRHWRVTLGATLAVPLLRTHDGIAAATTADTLYMLDGAGRTLQRTALPATPSAPGLVAQGGLAVPLHDGTVALLNAARSVYAQIDAGDVVLAQPVSGPRGDLIVLTRAGELRRIVGTASNTIAQLGSAATGSLSRVGDAYVVGLLDGRVLLVDDGGTIHWSFEAGESIDEPVVADAGALYVATRRGTLIKLVDG